ncbi:YncE family protein [Streptomyces sp. URMC 125]|uniref:YncE family protein n=1 Tax=Streptomyces sp. URMC 125 TaxID=3423419 RepID=UPI003F1B5F90
MTIRTSPHSTSPRHRRVPRAAGCAAALALVAAAAAPASAAAPADTGTARAGLNEVMFVGNNWEGTADVIESTGDYARAGRIDVVPDKGERLREIRLDPIRPAFYPGIRETFGEGHDRYVDDMYSTPDGSAVVVSRPSFADVVSIDVTTGRVDWRFPVSGFRSDHMAVSPDGRKVAVPASTSDTVHVPDIVTGKEPGSFRTGGKPHENVFTDGGRYVWNMSIGEVDNALDAPWPDWTKGDRRITVADADPFERVRVIDMRERPDAFGRGDLSDSVRPVASTPDGSTLHFQVSFFNGFLEYDVAADEITRLKELPKNPGTGEDRTTWVDDSRHHGMSVNPQGTRLCVAGTMDDYATVVDRGTLREGPLVPAAKPYRATVSGDGRHGVVSESGADRVSVIDFETGRKVVSVPVGDHPQRVRAGHVPAGWTGPSAG